MSREADAVELSISRSLDIKGKIVEEDLRERGLRAHLNLGHTFAHALESAMGFGTWSHGEAVAWGIDRATSTREFADDTSLMALARPVGLYRPGKSPLCLIGAHVFPKGATSDEILAEMKAWKAAHGRANRIAFDRHQ